MQMSESEEPKTHRTKPKESNDQHLKKRTGNKPFKNDSGASSSLIDESKEDDSSLISKCKNLTQICKTDGAKGLCDELSKMVKGSIGNKIQKFKENSKIMSKINEISHSTDKKRSEVSNSPPSRPLPPKISHHQKNSKSDQRNVKNFDDENESTDRVKQENIEKWMRNVNSANRKSGHKSQTFETDLDDAHDEEDDEFNENSKFNRNDDDDDDDDDEILPRRHHRRLSNINEDSNDNDTIRNGALKKHKSKSAQRKPVNKSPARPLPPKRPPPPRPSSPPEEPIRTFKKPKELPTSVHDRLMRDMKSNTKIARNTRNHRSIDSFSAFESPEPVRKSQENKPKLPPPPRPPSMSRINQKKTKCLDSSGFESDLVTTKYSNTLKKNHISLEKMASMVEYEINAHTESNLKHRNKNNPSKQRHDNMRTISRSPERNRTRSKPRQQSRHNSQAAAASISPVARSRTRPNVEEKTRRKPPIHR